MGLAAPLVEDGGHYCLRIVAVFIPGFLHPSRIIFILHSSVLVTWEWFSVFSIAIRDAYIVALYIHGGCWMCLV